MMVRWLERLSAPRSATTRVTVNTGRTVWYHVVQRMAERNGMKFIRYVLLRRQGTAHMRDTNCDIFSWASSQFAVWAWNMAAMAAASSSFVTTDLTARACAEESHDML